MADFFYDQVPPVRNSCSDRRQHGDNCSGYLRISTHDALSSLQENPSLDAKGRVGREGVKGRCSTVMAGRFIFPDHSMPF